MVKAQRSYAASIKTLIELDQHCPSAPIDAYNNNLVKYSMNVDLILLVDNFLYPPIW